MAVGGRSLFVWEGGPRGAAVVTLVHGYPGSSHDFAGLAGSLVQAGRRVVALDLLGFGASDKPIGHAYSVGEQADLIEELWGLLDVERCAVVAHDYGVSVAQELLARRTNLPARVPLLDALVLLNGGAISRLHRPTEAQTALLDPHHGPAIAAAITREMLGPGLAATFSSAHPATEQQLDDLWAALARDDGNLLLHALLHYVGDRREHAARWEDALAHTRTPLTLVWGPEDPVSGAHMLEGLRGLAPAATVVALDGVGHWPQLEDPERVRAAVAGALGAG